MGDLSKNFRRIEFACKGETCCGNSAPVHPDLVKALQQLRSKLNSPLTILSGFRCRTHNKEVKGKALSFHTLGMAVDVLPPEWTTPTQLAYAAEGIDLFKNGGIGVYNTWVHLDVRSSGPARW